MSASVTGTSRVDSQNPSEMDINASMAVSYPSGSSAGFVYAMGSTNAMQSSPTATSSYYFSNPGSFAVAGTVLVAVQTVFNDSPAKLALSTDRFTELRFDYNDATEHLLVPNTAFTCTIYDGSTLIGSSTATISSSAIGSQTVSSAQCGGDFPPGEDTSGGPDAWVDLPATYDAGAVYTYIISH